MVLKNKQNFDQLLLRVVDGGLAGVIFVVPFLMGGRHAIGQLALTVLAVGVAWAWALRQSLRNDIRHNDAAWRSTAVTPLVLIGLMLVVLQTVPLPPWLLAHLSPNTANILPLWNADATTPGSFGHWPCISFAPAETLAGLVIFLDFVLLFFVVVQRINHIEDVEQLLRWCALSAIVMASFGILQLLAANGKFFWFYEHPFSSTSKFTTGSFTNRNHFTQFLALGAGPLIWWLQDAMRRTHSRTGGANSLVYLLGLALGIVFFTGLMSLSRGGVAAMFLAAAICTAVCYRTTSLGRRFVTVLAGAGVLIGISLAIFGFDRVNKRMEDSFDSSEQRDALFAGRKTIWATTLKAIPNYALLGTGVGSFGEVYPAYADIVDYEGTEPTHGENGYLQVLLETGVGGLVLILTGIVLCVRWCAGGIAASVPTRSRVCAGAIAGSLAASAAHATVDFVWYVPACMAIVTIFAACALRMWQMAQKGEPLKTESKRHKTAATFHIPNSPPFTIPVKAFFWPVAVVVLTCVGTWMISDRIGPAVAQTYWDEYLVARRHAAKAEQSTSPGQVLALADAKTQEQWIACLTSVIRWQPTHLQAHLKLVETHRRLFDILQSKSANPMSLLQISDAVFKEPQFQSRKVLATWLPEAIGPHWTHLQQCLEHATRALVLCPLKGRAYVHIAELSFLWTSDPTAKQAYVEQAMRVRPFDGEVLYAAANQALLAGKESQWREYLKRAFQCGRRQQQQLITDRIAATPPPFLPAIIDDILREFQPDLINTRFLHSLCVSRCTPEQLAPLLQYWVNTTENEAAALNNAEAGGLWSEAGSLHSRLHNDAETLRCARNAFLCDSGNFNIRYSLGLCLLGQSQFAEAESHLRWCLQRAPKNATVENNLRAALKGQDDQRRAAKENESSINR